MRTSVNQTRYETTGWQPLFLCGCVGQPHAKKREATADYCREHHDGPGRVLRLFRATNKRKQ